MGHKNYCHYCFGTPEKLHFFSYVVRVCEGRRHTPVFCDRECAIKFVAVVNQMNPLKAREDMEWYEGRDT